MYVNRSLHGDPRKNKLIDEVNLKNCVRLYRRQQEISLLVLQWKKESLLFILNILTPEYIITSIYSEYQTWTKHGSEPVKKNGDITLKKRLDKSINHQIHQIIRINRKNGKTEYRGRTYAKNKVVIEPGWISNVFEFREPEF